MTDNRLRQSMIQPLHQKSLHLVWSGLSESSPSLLLCQCTLTYHNRIINIAHVVHWWRDAVDGLCCIKTTVEPLRMASLVQAGVEHCIGGHQLADIEINTHKDPPTATNTSHTHTQTPNTQTPPPPQTHPICH